MESEEMINDAFLRVFSQLDKYDQIQAFKPWFHTLVVRSSLNFIKKWHQEMETKEIDHARTSEMAEHIMSQINTEDIHKLVKTLARTYQTTFNLYVVEGYSHSEIAQLLGISENTSRSNLLVARQKLQNMILNLHSIKI